MRTELQQPSDSANRLSHNESPYTPPINFEVILQNFEMNRYPDASYQELTALLAQMNGVRSEELILSNGSDDCIRMVIDAYTQPGDALIIPTPTFTQYTKQAQITYRRPIEVIQPDMQLNLPDLAQVVKATDAALIFICSPNNPTGITITEKALREFLDQTTCMTLLDEAYCEFSTQSLIGLISEYPRLTIIKTLSKAYGMAGLRVGYAVSNRENIKKLENVRAPYALSSLSAHIALYALQNTDFYEETSQLIQAEKKIFLNRLSTFKDIKVFPSEANFLLIEAKGKIPALKIRFNHAKVPIRFFDDPILQDAFRITIGNTKTMTQVYAILKEVLG
jgi:histidinol-phosphate aminotransferase